MRMPQAEGWWPGNRPPPQAERLGHLGRAVIGQQHSAGAGTEARGRAGQACEQYFRAGIGERGHCMVFGEPVTVIAEGIGRLRQLDRFLDRARRSLAADDGRLVEYA